MILVVGATGTVGRRVIDSLLEKNISGIRALARGKSDWEGNLFPGYRRQGIDVVVGDSRSESTVERAVEGCKAIINCAGLMRETADDDLQSVNVEAVENLVSKGKSAGVQRFVHLSCLGSTEHSSTAYFSCKWDAEEIVRKSGMHWTIFRPSLVFDEQSALFRITNFWIQRTPFIVMVGSGLNRFQPISAEDVAECMVQCVYDRETSGKTYDLTGPETLDLHTLLIKIAESQGRQVREIKIPSSVGIPIAGLIGKLNPKSPIDNNVMSLMTSELIGDEAPMLKKFKLKRLSIAKALAAIESTDEEESDE